MVTNEGPIPGCNTQFHYEIKDPMDGASVSSGGFDKVAKNDKGFEIEPPSSKFFRWIFSFSKESSTETFNLFLQEIIAENQQNLPDNVLTYDDCVKTSIDLITGFHFETGCEHLYVLESRATSPNLFSKKL
ncbi:hypothetical protein TVAG_440540 [Trichomonas vaginalis G3]|uniref:Uncharacterized protein n=1 Tax=Trichomonas vaginalis (strain ATCC PRA-98 / G3) TaxID=412133 RepID=A2F1L0_TRIV3|nr:hypothetical protein TVAGG3_0369250 [Trichomonas vaginalis G3]EAY01228.1 hypothetical protein TVAG_440540 [Trichomonas vaginalis G3]KAI5532492.1 hypothetical protein TVAGG3_0369250 [Trichomonas vaginalis G3]|eukprot:XP_001330144.1 hypothetical protein [Trichomonas vaginalis G3]